MATLGSYTLVPELQTAYYRFVTRSKMNKARIPFPVEIPNLYLTENSFLNLLFNDDYNLPDYEYLYTEQINPFQIPRIAYDRITIYPGASQYMIMDSTGSNIFDLQPDDFTMLDALLAYRNDSTSLNIIDTTGSLDFTLDSTSGLFTLVVDYDSLSTELSKLIYLYLDLEIYGNYERYNNLDIISTGGLLETCYESYVMEKYFEFISGRIPNLITDNAACEDPT